ncbi:MAG: OsmC family protein [Gemmatimonadetes bacterium]|nr:OsmC family protein [Gemmatimonadota bacterium]
MSPTEVLLRWRGDGLVFSGGAPGGPEITLDSEGRAGPSPTQALLLSLAGCMGVDVRMILEKGRVPLESLDVRIEAERVEEPPRRFRSVRLTYRLRGPRQEDRAKVDRAVELSREKYCSVLHTLRPDLELDIRVELT